MEAAPDYLNLTLPKDLQRVVAPVVDATPSTLEGYGFLVDDPKAVDVEIVRWPAQGWRPVDSDSGDEGGTVDGVFHSEWRGDVLYGKNEAVGGHYILGYGTEPDLAAEDHGRDPERILVWHANYHPDGGQLFFPLDGGAYMVPLALPGDDVEPADFVCFRVPAERGLYIHPNVWHEGVFPVKGQQRFFDKQGAVHARVSVDLAGEFSCLLELPLAG